MLSDRLKALFTARTGLAGAAKRRTYSTVGAAAVQLFMTHSQTHGAPMQALQAVHDIIPYA